MKDAEVWGELNNEIEKLSEEYARLKNKVKPFETEGEKELREDQLRKDRREKWQHYDSLGDDFEKKRDYIQNLKKEVETMRVMERKDGLIQKLKDQTITEKELSELQVLTILY
jgi:hypothetical protein